MEKEFEKPELQAEPALSAGRISRPGPGERVPMPAGPGTSRRPAGERSSNIFGLVLAAVLAAGLASGIVFKGDVSRAKQAAPAQTNKVQVISKEALAEAAPVSLSREPVNPVLPPSELATLETPGSPVETTAPAPRSIPSPLPFFNSEEAAVVPKTAALQPYNNSSEPAQNPASAGPVLPAASRLAPRLRPMGGPAGALAAPVSPGACTSCAGAVAGVKTSAALQGGEGFIQHEISTTYAGLCEGKHIYDYVNLTSNKTIGMKVVTSAGEAWTFTLKPGEKTSLKSSTEFTGGNFESYRLSEVIN